MSDGMHNYIQRNELRTSNQRTICCTRLNIIAKSHLGKAVTHIHTHTHTHPELCMNSQVSLKTWPSLFLSLLQKRKGKKRKRRNGNKTLNIVQCDIPEENNTLSCSLEQRLKQWRERKEQDRELRNTSDKHQVMTLRIT